MAQKQQALINALNKLTRQFFLYNEDKGMDKAKVRLRNSLHRVEEVSANYNYQRVEERMANNSIGLMHPQHEPYVPVAGWPELHVEELVLNTMANQLDPRIWQALRSQFERTEIKRAMEKHFYKDIMEDLTVVHSCPTSGYHKIKAHLAESEARIYNVKAGFDFKQHFLRALEERLKRETKPKETVQKFCTDPDLVLAMERQRRDMILFLECLKDFLEKMMLIRVRHLKSHTPINLSILGMDKDHAQQGGRSAVAAGNIARSPVHGLSSRAPYLQFPGAPHVQHNFKDQILSERPPYWPVKVNEQWLSRGSNRQTGGTFRGSIPPPNREAGRESLRLKKPHVKGCSSVLTTGSDSPSAGSDNLSREDNVSLTAINNSLKQRGLTNREIMERFRKIWPPVWISMASYEQGCYIVDPSCPTKEYNHCLSPCSLRRRKSLSDILETREEWARMRSRVSRNLDENLWREDREKVEKFHVEYATLSHVPLSKPYHTHQRHVEELLRVSRRQRQKIEIYDCELSEWYKYLMDRVHQEVGKTDEEINKYLESIKVHFNMSATFPRLGKAKLALITMSLPAYIVCQVHVQRALTFILTQVLQAPAPLLTGWLASRGLPLVLLESHTI